MARAHPPVTELTADESLILSAIEAGTYFIENEVPAGTINGSNVTFTLASIPNPETSLVLKFGGQDLKAGGEDYSISGLTITLNNAPITGDILLADYRLDPT